MSHEKSGNACAGLLSFSYNRSLADIRWIHHYGCGACGLYFPFLPVYCLHMPSEAQAYGVRRSARGKRNSFERVQKEEHRATISTAYAHALDTDDRAAIERARKELYEAHKGLIMYWAFKYEAFYGYPLNDLVSAGNYGLVEALQNYDPHKGTFAGYASNFIRGQMRRYVAREKRYYSEIFDIENTDGGEPELENISNETTEEASEQMIASMDVTRLLDSFEDLATLLNPREGQILRDRYLSTHPKELKEIAVELGISRQRVQQIEEVAIRKLREHFQQDQGTTNRNADGVSDATQR